MQAPPVPEATGTSDDLVPRRGSTSNGNGLVSKRLMWAIRQFYARFVESLSPWIRAPQQTYFITSEPTIAKSMKNTRNFATQLLLRKNSRPVPGQHTQRTLAESFSRKVLYERKSQWWQDITNAITKFIAKEMLPMQLVEREGFKELVAPYTVRSRKYFSETSLPSLYDSTHSAVMDEVQKVTHFATTTEFLRLKGTSGDIQNNITPSCAK